MYSVSWIGDLSRCRPPGFESPKLMEYVHIHQLFIMLVVLHWGWLVARWPPIWLTLPRVYCVRSALVICMQSGWINWAVVLYTDCRVNHLKLCLSWGRCCCWLFFSVFRNFISADPKNCYKIFFLFNKCNSFLILKLWIPVKTDNFFKNIYIHFCLWKICSVANNVLFVFVIV